MDDQEKLVDQIGTSDPMVAHSLTSLALATE